jgi:hypothetical protein
VPITTRESRERILGDLAAAADQLALASACLSEAYELLTIAPADRLEAELFAPVQKAFGRCKRTASQFAGRTGMDTVAAQPQLAGRPSRGVRSFVDRAVAASGEADLILAELQDSMLPVEAGDAELRAGLAEVRGLLAGLAPKAREFIRTLGR